MQIKLEYEAFEVVDVILKPVGPVLWRITLSKAHVVDSDYAEMFGPDRDLLSEEVAPGRLTVKQQQSIWTRTFVDIMHTEAWCVIIAGAERPGTVERFVGGDGGHSHLILGLLDKSDHSTELSNYCFHIKFTNITLRV